MNENPLHSILELCWNDLNPIIPDKMTLLQILTKGSSDWKSSTYALSLLNIFLSDEIIDHQLFIDNLADDLKNHTSKKIMDSIVQYRKDDKFIETAHNIPVAIKENVKIKTMVKITQYLEDYIKNNRIE